MSPQKTPSASQTFSASHKNFYAIYLPKKKYHTIVTTWKDCEALIKGQSGASYKKFTSENEAKNFLAQFATPTTTENSFALKNTSSSKNAEETQKKSVYYAVYLGRTQASYILEDWETCKGIVSGEATAQFKKLRSRAEAESFLAHIKNKTTSPSHTHNYSPQPLPANLILSSKHKWNVYTDGSHIKELPYIGWGWSLVRDEETVIGEEVGFFKNQSGLNNVAGELKAVLHAITTLAPSLSPSTSEASSAYLTISYDYIGIEKWAHQIWKAKNPFTQQYQTTIEPFLDRIRFNKVTAHGANPWNDRIDKLVRFQLKKFNNTLY